ncbi:uncharacterized protein N7518_007217 [Penicillium psychrosexuale]|uniref:uncharacterized protein n=1 Tax=Penicillium psychrosexuale TaxID=1002107 RepID=UPI002545AE11|nr:uncharacterized protein N7518_007217 [Penicillium psychrosexuale]KAJ5790206.1 hypothetical protein N7518_007217 [Penicillium psychrosexuale]
MASSSKKRSKSAVPSLTGLAFKKICKQLEAFVVGKKASATFVCGGLVPIGTNVAANSKSSKPISASPPVRICWRTDGDDIARELALPLDANANPQSASDDLRQLVAVCDPASFGRGQQDIIDPEYRKAGKLDPEHFFTSFHPAEFGILPNVEQVLLPNFNTEAQDSLPFRKLSAELYKLNVYSGPSGLFRQHVDTPRSKTQIGSLVVCLPSQFKGGDLVVNHEGRQVVFDWDQQSASAIQWAAFYSDCEHEIKTITEGERITLTYNLYITEPVGGSIPPSMIVDPKSFPLYGYLQELIMEPGFMQKGGALGFYCSHAYPHASDEAPMLLPRALKGADLVLYSVFKSLGIKIEVVPVIQEDDFRKGDYDMDEEYESLEYDSNPKDSKGKKEDDVNDKLLVGDKLHPYITTDMTEEFGETLNLNNNRWKCKHRRGVIWIGSPAHGQSALSYLAYGNEASISTIYSYAAMIAKIPPFLKRKGLVDA